MRSPTPICGAARPTPWAASIVSNMSATRARRSSSKDSTGQGALVQHGLTGDDDGAHSHGGQSSRAGTPLWHGPTGSARRGEPSETALHPLETAIPLETATACRRPGPRRTGPRVGPAWASPGTRRACPALGRPAAPPTRRRRRCAARHTARAQGRVGDEVVRRAVGDTDGDHVAGPRDARRPRAPRSARAGCRGPGPTGGAVAASLRPSPGATSTSTSRPSTARFSAQETSSCSAMSRSKRSCTTALGTWSVHRRGGRAGADGVLEGEGAGEARLAARPRGSAAKSSSVSPGKPTMMSVVIAASGMLLADPVDDAEELRAAVGAAHRLEHPVGARLQRHVQARHDVGGLGHRGDDVVGEGGRVRAGEAHPLEALDLAAGAQQLAEREPVAELDAVGVDVLAEQGDLDDALGDERLDLGEDLARAAVLLLAAQARHDAERAGVVAAHRDRHPAAVGRVAPGRQRRREDLERSRGSRPRRACCAAARSSRAGRRADVVGAEDDVDPRGALDDGVAVLLGHAAADGDLHVGVRGLGRAQLAEVAVELVVGVLAHRAGVEDDDVGDVGPLAPRGGSRGRRSRPSRAARRVARSRGRSSGTRGCARHRSSASSWHRQGYVVSTWNLRSSRPGLGRGRRY